MKKSDFTIKVADLLKETGKQDTTDFSELYTDKIPWLTKEWVSWSIGLESINDTTLDATITNLECQISDICDHCGKEYLRQTRCDVYENKFSSDKSQFQDDPEEEIFPINENQIIDIEDMIVQAIGLQEPLTKVCYDCLNKVDSEDDEEGLDYFETSLGNINFS